MERQPTRGVIVLFERGDRALVRLVTLRERGGCMRAPIKRAMLVIATTANLPVGVGLAVPALRGSAAWERPAVAGRPEPSREMSAPPILHQMRPQRPRAMMCAAGIATIIAIAACGSTPPAKAPRTAAAYAPETWASSSSTTVGSGDATSTSVTSYTVTVSKLADSTGQQANMTVNYRCGLGVAPCVWSSEASQYSGRTCPSEFHPTRSI